MKCSNNPLIKLWIECPKEWQELTPTWLAFIYREIGIPEYSDLDILLGLTRVGFLSIRTNGTVTEFKVTYGN